MGLDTLQEQLGAAKNAVGELLQANVAATAIGAGVAGVGLGVLGASLIGGKTKKKTRKSAARRKRITHTKRGLKQDRKRRSKQKWEVAYQRRKRRKKGKRATSRRGIHYTKKGQPYKIMSNGRARFIKKTKRRSK